MAHLIPDFAFALLPATIVTFQSLYDKDDIIKAAPETTFPEEAKPPVGPRFQNIKKIDAAVPLMILSGASFGKSTALMGCAYAVSRAIYTSSSKDDSVIEAGKNFMTFNLVLLSVSSALSAYTLLTRKPKYFK